MSGGGSLWHVPTRYTVVCYLVPTPRRTQRVFGVVGKSFWTVQLALLPGSTLTVVSAVFSTVALSEVKNTVKV